MKKTNKTKVALVNPPLLCDPGHPLFPPLSLAYMAAVLDQDGHEVKIIDCPICKIDHEKLKAELASFEPNLIGISCMTPTISSVLQSARVAKEACPNSKVVLGGSHVSFMDKQILSQEATVDIIVRGEGEQTLSELAQHSPNSDSLNEIKGITFKNNDGQITQTPDRPFIQNLDELPRPAYKYFPMEKYRVFGKTYLLMMTSRGCPFQCSFCISAKMFGGKFRTRSPKNVVDELEWLRDMYGASFISFCDDTLTFDRKRMLEICDEMKNRKIGVSWGCLTRVDCVDKELLAKMREANCQLVHFGVESGCQKILDAVKKRISIEQCEKAVKWTKEEGLFAGVSAILGYPGETKDTVKQTLDFIRRLEPDGVWLSIATPFPGTELRVLLESMGWKMSEDWHLYDMLHPVIENPLLPTEEISKIRKTFYSSLFSPRYILRETVKGYLKGNFFSQFMARTALNHMLWRISQRALIRGRPLYYFREIKLGLI
jgi:anaerobic magnesium-protoporphyrin IX monomethyl ester cyclase